MSRRRQKPCGRRKMSGALFALAGLVGASAPTLAFADILQELYELRMACETGDGDACYTLGGSYKTKTDLWGQPIRGEGVKRDDRRAAYYFRQSCSLNVAEGCNVLGHMYEAGKGVEKDTRKADGLFQAACDLRGGVRCGDDRKVTKR